MPFYLLVVIITILCHWRAVASENHGLVRALVWNVSVDNQVELNEFIVNVTTTHSHNKNIVNHLNISLAGGNNYMLDILRLMNIGVNGSLILKSRGDGRAEISCTAYVLDLEVLRRILQPLSRVSLVILDGLMFTRCPLPILIEEASEVIIQNCFFQ